MVQQPISLKLVPGGKYVLTAGGDQPYLLDPADWELRPESIEQIVPTVHTLKAAGDTTKEVRGNARQPARQCKPCAAGQAGAILHGYVAADNRQFAWAPPHPCVAGMRLRTCAVHM